MKIKVLLIITIIFTSSLRYVGATEKLDNDLAQAILKGDIPAVMSALNNGGNPNSRYRQLPLAAISIVDDCEPEILLLLIKYGAKLETKFQHNGYSLVHFAAFSGDLRCLKILKDNGANLSAEDKQGESALFSALSMNKPEAFGFLINSGVNPYIKNNNGYDVFHFSILLKLTKITRPYLNCRVYDGKNCDILKLHSKTSPIFPLEQSKY